MTANLTIHRRIHFRAAGRRIRENRDGSAQSEPSGRIPRVARLMALAIRLETLIADGEAPNYAALACLAHVSRARVTQIANLTLLAPGIQEAILFLPPVIKGRDPLTEREL